MKQLLSHILLLLAFVLAPFVLMAQSPASLDANFNPGSGANDLVHASAVQPDGKILIGGWFTSYNGIGRNYIARLNADGSLDTGFDPGSGIAGGFFNRVYSIVLQPNGKIIIAGSFTNYNGIARRGIARVNTDGSLDTSFDPGTGANSDVFSAIIQPDGKIIIAGSFFYYNGIAQNSIARLNPDGSLDTSFNPGTGVNLSWGIGAIAAAALNVNGKIIIAGDFNSYNGTVRNRIAILNSDGTLDTTFNPGAGADSLISAVKVQPDGKILIGGWFTSYNGTARNGIARLNINGSLDTAFDPGAGTNNSVFALALQPDGKIIIGGAFHKFNNTTRVKIARLNSDGSLDLGFNSASGADNNIFTVELQADGKIIIGGWLTSYKGTARNHIARIYGGNPTGMAEAAKGLEIKLYPNPSQGQFQLELASIKAAKAELIVTDLTGKVILTKEMKASNGSISEAVELKTAKGIYLLQVKAEDQIIIRKVIVE
jgi:uncharacterized delta-60 repeat protein